MDVGRKQPRRAQLWILLEGNRVMDYGPGHAQPSPAQPSQGRRSGSLSCGSGGGGGGGSSGSSVVPTLFGDGYSWVDNTDYVVIA